MLWPNRAHIALTYTGFLILLSGCTMYGIAKVSEPTVADTGNERVELKDDILVYRDLTVSVKPQNYYVSFFSIGPVVPIVPVPTVGDPPVKRKGQDFLLVIQMETESEGYKFNPTHVVIQYNNNTYKPIAALGPYPGGGYAREVARAVPGHKWECLPPKNAFNTDPGSLIVKSKVCFEVVFPLDTLRPEEEFRVTLGGIEKDGNTLRAPTLLFRPSSRGGFTLMM